MEHYVNDLIEIQTQVKIYEQEVEMRKQTTLEQEGRVQGKRAVDSRMTTMYFARCQEI